ncbi:MAG: DUF2806 domain-containing protein [Candidatus Thorarchaeota archaeon]
MEINTAGGIYYDIGYNFENNIMKDEDKNKIVRLIDFLQNLDLPSWLVKNVITALGKGVYNLTLELTEIPVNYLKNHNEKVKIKGNIKRDLIKKASIEYSKIFDNNPEFAERALINYGIRILEEQQNREIIALKTLKNLEGINSENVDKSGEEIEIDWLTAFWRLAETKTEEDIREILSKILANEIVMPKSYSLHTLQTLSVLSSEIGHIFKKICNMSIDDGEMAFFIHPDVFMFQSIGNLEGFDLSLNDLIKLDGAGLIRSAETIKLNFGESDWEDVDFAGKRARFNYSVLQLDIIYFTKTGRELRNLLDLEINLNYAKLLISNLKNKLEPMEKLS